MREPAIIHGILYLAVGARVVVGQQAPPARSDSLRLRDLYAGVLADDPRQRQLALQTSATRLRLQNIAASRQPALSGSPASGSRCGAPIAVSYSPLLRLVPASRASTPSLEAVA